MPDHPGAGRLDPDIVAAYVDGQLSPEERARVEAAVAADPETYEGLVETIRAVDDESIVMGGASFAGQFPSGDRSLVTVDHDNEAAVRDRVVPFHRRPQVLGGIGVLAAAAAVLLVVRVQPEWWQRLRGQQPDQILTKLIVAVGEEPYIEARLVGGFEYGPAQGVVRSGSKAANQNLALLVAAGEIEQEAARRPTRAAEHALGVAQLLTGETEASVATLRSVNRRAPGPDTATNLAAALIALGRSTGDQAHFKDAVAILEPVVRSAQPPVEARFNLAVALEALKSSNAVQAWDDAAAAEPGTPWAREAVRRAELLKSTHRP
jgi:hypothetical protein